MTGPVPVSLTRPEARRVLLASQGFADRRHATPTMRTLERAVRRTSVLQIDSVNVLKRAHYLPLFSRMGSYDVHLLDRASGKAPRRLVEYWAHVAALMPVDLWPVMQHRMARYREDGHEWTGVRHGAELVGSVLAQVRERGPCTARDLDDGLPRARDHWGWNWSETKKVLEYLFAAGEVAVAGRTASFERLYDVPERVLPREVLDLPVPTAEEAHRELVRRAARSLGVSDLRSLADYFRMPREQVGAAVRDLVEEGELQPARVDGCSREWYLHRDARLPRRISAATLLSPFDPVVWERRRTERLFGFRYRIEIYVPAARRVHGYYVLPFLLDDRLVARVDLKADRARSTLLVQSAHAEPDVPPDTAERLAASLDDLAGWLGLHDVVVQPRGDLAPALCAAARPTRRRTRSSD